MDVTVSFSSQQEAYALLGGHDEFLRLLTAGFACQIVSRGDGLSISGDAAEVEAASLVVRELQNLYRQGTAITSHEVRYAIRLSKAGDGARLHGLFSDSLLVTARGRQIRPKTVGQQRYLDAIRRHAVTFGVGPAGTGKTYLAVVLAVLALRAKEVRRIILTRPAVEAGERLGFLPGDMQEKVDPYLRPLYDALEDIFGLDTYQKLVTKGIIEIAPLAYMRGRTLDSAFIILDEAQNTTSRQMKMFLTRLGMGSRMVVNGDLSQIDLPRGVTSGLAEAVTVLADVSGVAVASFTAEDIIRHDVVTRIVTAYDRYDRKNKEGHGSMSSGSETA
ncbi:MAG: PhoH family protein [Schwartzia sp. (in: firmicutes)]